MALNIQKTKSFNPVLSALNIVPTDTIINIRETGDADASFIIAHLLKQIFLEKNKCCLVTLHNVPDHYHFTCRKIGLDLKSQMRTNNLNIINTHDIIIDSIGEAGLKPSCISSRITAAVSSLQDPSQAAVYIVIDDVSHLLDMGFDGQYVMNFLSSCVNAVSDTVRLVASSHVCNKRDEVFSNYLRYVSDVSIQVSPLKTGKSSQVTGLVSIDRNESDSSTATLNYHYKAFDNGIRIFPVGECLKTLYR